MTRIGRIVLWAAVVFYLAAAVNDAPAAYGFASALVGVLLTCYVLSRLSVSGLRAETLSFPDRLVAGRPGQWRIELSNPCRVTKTRGVLRLRAVPETLKVAPQELAVRLPAVAPGMAVEVGIDLQLDWRGWWRLEDTGLEGTDPLGLYRRPESPMPPRRVLVLPATYPMPAVPAAALLAPETRRRMAAERRDQGEFRGVREFVPGDDPRHIHWRMTAHRAKLQVKLYDEPLEAYCQIWIPLVHEGAEADSPGGPSRRCELSLAAGLSVARVFAGSRVQACIRLVGLPPLPVSSDADWAEALSKAATASYVALGDFAAEVVRWAASARRASTVLIFGANAEALEAAEAAAADRGLASLVISAGAPAKPEWLELPEDSTQWPALLGRVARAYGYAAAAAK